MDKISKISRRSFVGSALATPVVLASTSFAKALADAEQDAIADLYEAAKAEGGKLTIYAGGDKSSRADRLRAAFNAKFPEIELNYIVDYSKFHDVRVNNQLERGNIVPDVVQFQTVQNFPRWKEMGVLENFRPEGFDNIYHEFKDPDGAWTSVLPIGFSYMYDLAGVGEHAPRSPEELADPRWRGQIAASYPHDDDAVLFLYKKYVDAYGWAWVEKMAAQEIQFNRGSFVAGQMVRNGEKLIGIGGSGTMTAVDAPVRWTAAGDQPFMAWGQRVAMLKSAQNKSAAKLYISWQVSRERQEASYNGWSVRTDVEPGTGLKPIWETPNAHLSEYPEFMADRAEVERWKQTFAVYFGDVQGAPSAGFLGPRPT